jgi:hypothetical protein
MRDSDQIRLTPEEYADHKRAERRRTLKDLLAGLLYARENRTDWYTWVVEGMPKLTPDEYDAIKAKRRTRPKSK